MLDVCLENSRIATKIIIERDWQLDAFFILFNSNTAPAFVNDRIGVVRVPAFYSRYINYVSLYYYYYRVVFTRQLCNWFIVALLR